MNEQKDPNRATPVRASAPAPRKVVRIEELLGNACEVTVLHAGEEYRLRVTRNGKLILTK